MTILDDVPATTALPNTTNFGRSAGVRINAMTDWIDPPPRRLNELEAFDAMRLFLEAYWHRGGEQSDDIAVLLGSLDREAWESGKPLDLAQWHDFRNAVVKAISNDS